MKIKTAIRRILTAAAASYAQRRDALYRDGIIRYIKNNKGFALTFVMAMCLFLSQLAVNFYVVVGTNLAYSTKLRNRAKASYVSQSGVELAKFILFADQRGQSIQSGTKDKNIDSYKDDWAIAFDVPLSLINVPENGSLRITIDDENSKLNANVLATDYSDKTPFYGIAQRLFLNLGLSMDFADYIVDWIDPDDNPFQYGVESNYYQTLTPAYKTKNTGMDSIDELFMLKDMTPKIFYGEGELTTGNEIMDQTNQFVDHNRGKIISLQDLVSQKTVGSDDKFGFDKMMGMDQKEQKDAMAEEEKQELLKKIGPEKSRRLGDYLTVYGRRENHLDDSNKININTASYRLIMSLADDMDDIKARELIARRQINPYKSVDEVKDIITNDTARSLLSVQSHVFRITSRATINGATTTITAVFNRDNRLILYWSEE